VVSAKGRRIEEPNRGSGQHCERSVESVANAQPETHFGVF